MQLAYSLLQSPTVSCSLLQSHTVSNSIFLFLFSLATKALLGMHSGNSASMATVDNLKFALQGRRCPCNTPKAHSLATVQPRQLSGGQRLHSIGSKPQSCTMDLNFSLAHCATQRVGCQVPQVCRPGRQPGHCAALSTVRMTASPQR